MSPRRNPDPSPPLSTSQEQLLRQVLADLERLLPETARGGSIYQLDPRRARNCTRFAKSLAKSITDLLQAHSSAL